MKATRSELVLLYAPLGLLISIWLIVPALLGLLSTLTNYAPAEPSVDWVGLRNFQAILADRTRAGVDFKLPPMGGEAGVHASPLGFQITLKNVDRLVQNVALFFGKRRPDGVGNQHPGGFATAV